MNTTALTSQIGRSSPACITGPIESRKCIQIIRETNMPVYAMWAANTCSNVKASRVCLMGWGGVVHRLWDIVCLTRRRSLAGQSSSKDSLPRGSSSLFATLSFCPHLSKEKEETKMRAKPFWFSVFLLTQCLQGLIVSEDQNVEEFHVQVTNYQGWGACRGSFEISWSYFGASY